MTRDPGAAGTSITWRTLLTDNFTALSVLIAIFLLAYLVPYLLLPGLLLGVSGLPMVPLMFTLSFGALLFKAGALGNQLWWFASAGLAWFLTPVFGEQLLLPWLDRIVGEASVSTVSGELLPWTQWVWTLPFLMLYVIIGLMRMRRPKSDAAPMKTATA